MTPQTPPLENQDHGTRLILIVTTLLTVIDAPTIWLRFSDCLNERILSAEFVIRGAVANWWALRSIETTCDFRGK